VIKRVDPPQITTLTDFGLYSAKSAEVVWDLRRKHEKEKLAEGRGGEGV
jgi:hypothetical protein